jgi:hypothetical protein
MRRHVARNDRVGPQLLDLDVRRHALHRNRKRRVR